LSLSGYKKNQNCDETPVQQTTLSSRTNDLYKCVTNVHRFLSRFLIVVWGDRDRCHEPIQEEEEEKPEGATSALSSQCLAPHLENEGSCVRDASAFPRDGATRFPHRG
jgi:hypothetical protein